MKYLVFDVESVGLHGEGFAVGAVVVDESGKELSSCLFVCPIEKATEGKTGDLEWVNKNIPSLALTDSCPTLVRHAFWEFWRVWKEQGAILVADCAWPVEARFLIQCVEDDKASRNWEGPYPLHDLASMLLAKGKDPTGKFGRLETENPEHNPLMDARQSARILIENLHKTTP